MKTNTAIVTGASEGIGAAFTKILIQNGWEVIGISRDKNKLNTLRRNLDNKQLFKPEPCDVSDFEKLKLISKENNPASLLFLNAGIYNPINASENNLEIYKKHIDVNYLGVINCYEAFLPKMLQKKKGHIIIMSSITGWIGLPKAAAYGPTKAALRSFAQSIRYDLNSKGIKVQLCSPGFVNTQATSINDFYMPGLMNVKEAANLIFKYMSTNKFEFSFPLSFSIFMKIFSYLPDKVSSYLIKKFIV
ncbi:SDR family NAD(P)-dependent oxidoreductase [bacterium]|nr:SDR family NAD(P)-dependent oxidoreductase [bacterium]